MAQTVINDSQGIVVREAGTGTRFENVVTNAGNVGVGAPAGDGKVIGSLTLTSGGSGYTNGTYSQVALTGGSGTGATADIVVATNAVTAAVLRNPGQGYAAGDTLSSASIGGGTGFVATVGTTASILRSDGTVVGSRIGAGTTTPRAAFDLASGLFYATSLDRLARAPLSGTTPTLQYSSVLAQPTEQIAQNLQVNTFSSHPQIDASLQPSALISGYLSGPSLTVTTVAQTTTLNGYSAVVYRARSGDVSTGNTTVSGFIAHVGVLSGVGAASTTLVSGFRSAPIISAVGHTIATFVNFNAASPSFNVASTITDFYGFRQESYTGSGTITNRWGVSQEDTAANNVFAGRSAMGQAAGTAATALVDVGASTTARSSLRIRSGTAPTAPNDGDIWFDGSAVKVQISGVTRTFTVT